MRHQLNTVSATFLVVASMLGTGILTTTGTILALVKSPEAVVGIWLVGGVLAWFGAFCYGEIMRVMPRNGGEATILHELFSPTLGEIAGWTSFVVGFAASNAASSLGLAAYLREAAPGLALPPHWIACAALMLVTALHSIVGPLGIRIQTLLAIGKFSLLAGLTLYGLFLFAPPPVSGTPVGALASGAAPANFGASWGVAMMLVMFAYSGWNAAIYVAGEIRNPTRTVRNAMILGTVVVGILYTAVNITLLTRLPVGEVEGVIPVVSRLVSVMFGSTASTLFSALVAFALLSSLGASAFLGPRVLATMLGWARGERHSGEPGHPMPVSLRVIWLQGGVSMLMVVTGTFEQILTVMGFLLGFFPILCVLGLYRRTCSSEALGLKLARYVFAPVFVVVMGGILVLGAQDRPREVAVALGLIGIFYLLRQGMRRFG